jgi:hypothetical protein
MDIVDDSLLMNMLSFEAQGVANNLHSEHSLARSSSGVSYGAFELLKRVNSVTEQACHFATQVYC